MLKKIITANGLLSLIFMFAAIVLFSLMYLKIGTLEKKLVPRTANLIKSDKYNNLGRISVSVHVNYIKKYLGDPVVIHRNEDKNQKEYIFIDPDYYVHIITDQYDEVLSFAITTRSKDFNPILKIKGVEVQLGKTTFYYKGNKPNDCEALAGNTAPSFYLEKYYGWNGTSYQDYLLGFNDAGYGDRGIVEATQPTEKDIENNVKLNPEYHCKLPSDEVRKKYTINTFSVGKYSSPSIGVDRRQMELIN